MPVFIQNIATAIPPSNFEQSFLGKKMKAYVGRKPATKRIIHSIYANSGIKKRHTVVNDFQSNGNTRLFFKENKTMEAPSTGARNQLYTQFAKKMYAETAKKLLDENASVSRDDITHVITVSCTGFFAPEPAYEIVKELQLAASAERYHIGFMGCFAVFPALKMARSICEARPDAVVMIVSVELCSLHLQASEKTDQLISAAVFADGAAGAIVSTEAAAKKPPSYRLDGFHTTIIERSEDQMAWTIGDTGFDMLLSTHIPDIIEANLAAAIRPLLETCEIDYDDIQHWALHPGGRAIIDKVEENLQLEPYQIESSRNVLAEYGNMSSATILFVLKDLLKNAQGEDPGRTIAIAFGPGLTVESALLSKL